MAIEGSLSDVSLADICQLLSMGRKAGCLTITDQSNFGYIYFESGEVVYASIVNRPDRLGEILVKNAAIQPDDLAKAMEEQGKESQKRLGEILVEAGALSSGDLERWVSVQVEEAVYHLFSWDQGTFHFKPDELPDRDQVLMVRLNMDGLLLEGARRVDEWSVIEKEVYSLDLIYGLHRDPQEAEGVLLSGNQKKLLPLLDGTRTVRDLVEESGLVEFETGKAIYELAKAGFAQTVGEQAKVPEDVGGTVLQEHIRLGRAFFRAGMLEDAAKEFDATVEANPSEPISRFFLGLIDLKSGKPERALGHFSSMPDKEAGGRATLRNRALALELLGRHEEALELTREAEKGAEGDLDLILARAILELKSGVPDSARSSFVEYRNRVGKGSPPPMYYAFAVLAAGASGYGQEAVSIGREGLRLYPSETSILVNTGAILDHQGNSEAAEQYFIRALNSGSEVPPQAHKNLGDQAFRRGDLQGAQTHYEKAVKLNPSLGDDVFQKLGLIALESQDTELAVLLFRRAVGLNPRNEEARTRLADLSALP